MLAVSLVLLGAAGKLQHGHAHTAVRAAVHQARQDCDQGLQLCFDYGKPICVDLQTNLENCGECGSICFGHMDSAAACTGSKCICQPSGRPACNGVWCPDFMNDSGNCGDCWNSVSALRTS
jgi:hypothetical protein